MIHFLVYIEIRIVYQICFLMQEFSRGIHFWESAISARVKWCCVYAVALIMLDHTSQIGPGNQIFQCGRGEMRSKINFIERGRLFRRELKRRGVKFLPMQVMRRIFEQAGV